MATTKTQGEKKKSGGSGEKRSSMLPKDHKGRGCRPRRRACTGTT